MNIVEKLGQELAIFQFNYFGLQDMATGFDIKLVIENEELIKNYYNKDTTSIDSIDTYIDCLFLEKYSKFTDAINLVNNEYKEKFNDIINFISNCKDTIKAKYYIIFLNKEYENLFKSENFSIKAETFNLIFKYYSGCVKPIEYSINNLFYMVLDNLENVQNVIAKDPKYIDLLIQKKLFEEIKTFRLKKYFELIKLLKIKKIDINKINIFINYILDFGNELYKVINEDNVIQYDHIIKTITEFLKEIKSKSADKFMDYGEKLELTRQKYLEKHGQTFTYDIPINELTKFLENENIPWSVKTLSLTHIKNKRGKMKSFHEVVMTETNDSITDIICTTSSPHDKYFTISKQLYLNFCDQASLNLLQYYINSEKIQEFISYIASLMITVCDHYNINYIENNFEMDFNIILNEFLELFKVNKENNKYAIIGLNYGLTMFIIGFIEKFLRLFYKAQNTEDYMDNDKFTLGNLLSEQNPTMIKHFGIDNIKVFNYYLTKGNKFEVGFNYRNNFAHYKNLKPKEMEFGITLKVLQILLMIINIFIVNLEEK